MATAIDRFTNPLFRIIDSSKENIMDTKKICDHKNALIIAHRGVSGIEPENTVSAFIAAANRSYFGIETDVHRTKDGKFILTHDDNAKRVSGVDLVIEDTDFDTLSKIKLFDTDKASYRSDLYFPALKEYIAICKKYGKAAVLELKNSFSEEDIGAIIEEIREVGYLDGTIFIAFDINNLHHVKKFSPEQNVQFLASKYTNPEGYLEQALKHGYDLDLNYQMVDKELIDTCHKNGLKVNVWTVDDPEIAKELIDMGVDSITTNICE